MSRTDTDTGADAVAVDRRGRRTPLGEFVFRLLADSGQSVSEVSRRSNLSRSFLYLLKDDRQVPSLDTLVALFEAIGVDVRVADDGEPGQLALTVDGRDWWIRLPDSNKRFARSQAAYAALSTNAVTGAPPEPYADDAPPPAAMSARAASPRSASPRSALSARSASYDRDSSFSRSRAADERTKLLGELLAAAGDLDPERLELLLEHARLLGRG
jgi:transcriptional regulator with XRE-family HTH domain